MKTVTTSRKKSKSSKAQGKIPEAIPPQGMFCAVVYAILTGKPALASAFAKEAAEFFREDDDQEGE